MKILFLCLVVFFGCVSKKKLYDSTPLGPYMVKEKAIEIEDLKIIVYEPIDVSEHKRIPIIAINNGIYLQCADSRALSIYFASYGMLTVCPESMFTGDGFQCEAALKWGAEYLGKRFANRIGTTGIDQGGTGAVSCGYYIGANAIAPVAPAWGVGDSSIMKKIRLLHRFQPMLVISGEYDRTVQNTWIEKGLKEIKGTPYIYARHKDANHFNLMSMSHHYLTQWFRFTLLDDEKSREYFLDSCYICRDKAWHVTKHNHYYNFFDSINNIFN